MQRKTPGACGRTKGCGVARPWAWAARCAWPSPAPARVVLWSFSCAQIHSSSSRSLELTESCAQFCWNPQGALSGAAESHSLPLLQEMSLHSQPEADTATQLPGCFVQGQCCFAIGPHLQFRVPSGVCTLFLLLRFFIIHRLYHPCSFFSYRL